MLYPAWTFTRDRSLAVSNSARLKRANYAMSATRLTLALRYNEQGADEMVFFDITASAHGRATMVSVIERAADQCFMPLTVGGGLRSVDDMYTMLRAGADKISINSSALANPGLIRTGAEKFGSQCIVVSIDAKKVGAGPVGGFFTWRPQSDRPGGGHLGATSCFAWGRGNRA